MVGFTFFLSRLIAPNKPTPEKLTSYECGEEPEGNSWIQFNPKFYVIALVFLLFDVEMIFIFPWATVFGNHQLIGADARWGWFSFAEMLIFMTILILGLVYVWVKGDLNWIRPNPIKPTVGTRIPAALYQNINVQQSQYKVKPFTAEAQLPETAAVNASAPTAETGAQPTSSPKKPMFKPTFKKPSNES